MNTQAPNPLIPVLGLLLVVVTTFVRDHWLLTVGLVVPLLVILPGLWRRNPKTLGGACMLSIVYVVMGIMESFANPEQRALAVFLTATALWAFVTLLLAARSSRAG
ncbi:MAG: DUF2069 domain-containing protein [Pseudomonadota bacterium]